MNCQKCGAALPDSAAFCPSCATPVATSGPGKAPGDLTREWLREVLERAGYDATLSEKDSNAVSGKYPGSRPNVVMTIRKQLGIITIASWWNLKKAGWGQEKALLAAINEANGRSWFNTCSVDKDGDLLVSAYICLTCRLTEQDIAAFLERTAESFMDTARNTELKNFLA